LIGSYRRYEAYKAFVHGGNDQETKDFYNLKSLLSCWGSKEFTARARSKVVSTDKEIDNSGLVQAVPLNEIIEKVAVSFKVEVEEILKSARESRKKNIPRWFAMKLCQEVGDAQLKEIASMFNVNHYSTVSQTIGRLNQLLTENENIKKEFNVLSQDLTP